MRGTWGWGGLALSLCLAASCGGTSSDDGQSTSASGLGLASDAAIAARTYEDGIYVLFNKDTVYDQSVCGSVSGNDIVEAAPLALYRVSQDVSSFDEIELPTEHDGEAARFIPSLGAGTSLTLSRDNGTDVVGHVLLMYDGEQFFEVPETELHPADNGSGTGAASTVILDVAAHPAYARVVYIDDDGQLRKFETGSRRTLADVGNKARIVTMDATTVTVAHVEPPPTPEPFDPPPPNVFNLVIETRSLLDGAVQGTPIRHAVAANDSLQPLALAANGTPSSFRVLIRRISASTTQVYRVSGTQVARETDLLLKSVQTRFQSIEIVATHDVGGVLLDAQGTAHTLATLAEIEDATCAEPPSGTHCGVAAPCYSHSVFANAFDGKVAQITYRSAFPHSTSLRVSTHAAAPISTLAPGTDVGVRVVNLAPAMHVHASTGLGEAVDSASLATGTGTTFATMFRHESLLHPAQLAIEATLADGSLVMSDVVELPFSVPRVNVVLWMDEAGTLQHTIASELNVEAMNKPAFTFVFLQNESNALTGNRWFLQKSFTSCAEPYCLVDMCTTPPAMTFEDSGTFPEYQLTRTYKIFYSSTAVEGDAPCVGDEVGSWTFTHAGTNQDLLVIAHALTETGGSILTLPRGDQ